ncbi:MAG: hypothetical protein HZC02_03085 [Candidatus Levybacteria bacterium]|nr:hypothetical protein [Candidatus Levybacteria bacterium]
MKKPVIFIIINIMIIMGLSIVQVVVANSISTSGIELNKLQQQISELKRSNAMLHEQVLIASSFTTIASKASSMGFEEGKSPLVISSPLPIARR